MKVFSGLTGITESFIAQGAYAALDYIQNLFRNLDSVAIDSNEPGQLITLSGSSTVTIESLSAGSYRLKANGVSPGSLAISDGLPVELPVEGEAGLYLCQLPSEESLILGQCDWPGFPTTQFHNIAWQARDMITTVSSTEFPVIDTSEKKFIASLLFPGGSAGDCTHSVYITNPAFWAPGVSQFMLEFWINPVSIGYGSVIFNCKNPGGNGAGSFAIRIEQNGGLTFKSADNSVSITTATGLIAEGAWSYVLFERWNGLDYLYINNVLASTEGGVADTYDYTFASGDTPALGISRVGESVPLNAYIEGFNIRKNHSRLYGGTVSPAYPTGLPVADKKYCLALLRGMAAPLDISYEVINRMGV